MNIKIKGFVLLCTIFLFFISVILAVIEEDRYKFLAFLFLNFLSGSFFFLFLLQYGFVPEYASIGYSKTMDGVVFVLQIQRDYGGPVKTHCTMINFFLVHLFFCLLITTVATGVLNFLNIKFPQIQVKFREIYNKFFD